MDITPWISTIVTIVLAMVTFYGIVNSRLATLEAKHEAEQQATRDSIELLRADVQQLGKIIERQYKFESDLNTAFKHIDEFRDNLKEIDNRLRTLEKGGKQNE